MGIGAPVAGEVRDAGSADRTPARVHAVVATLVGNTLEWFDFASYAFFAAVIARHFFPAGEAFAALLGTFAAFGVGFLARPLGAWFFGRMGDTRGRKMALLVSLPLMGAGTLVVGLTPDYATIGLAAPLLLAIGRLIQGFSSGGEVGNAIAFLSEWAPRRHRGLFASLQQSSSLLGTLLGSGCAALIVSTLAPADLDAWGWRLPFLFGGLVVAPLGMFLRRYVDETPTFEHAAPTRVATTAVWRTGVLAVALTAAWVTTFYVYLIYLPTFLPTNADVSPMAALWAGTLGLATMMVAIPCFGALSDRIGRRRPLVVAILVALVVPVPLFDMLTGGVGTTALLATMVGTGVLAGAFAGIMPVTLTEIFPTAARTTGTSISFGLSTALFGGFAPFIATSLIAATGSPIAPAGFCVATALLSLVAVHRLRETAFDTFD